MNNENTELYQTCSEKNGSTFPIIPGFVHLTMKQTTMKINVLKSRYLFIRSVNVKTRRAMQRTSDRRQGWFLTLPTKKTIFTKLFESA